MHEPFDPQESRLRSVAKALTYRLTGTLTTVAVTFAVTGQLAVALAVGSVEPALKILVYYLHERAWQRVPHGAMRRLVRPGFLAARPGRREKRSAV